MGTTLCSPTHLSPVSSTLLIPLVARAHGGDYYPSLACQDTTATGILNQLDVRPQPYLQDQATILNVLWRTQVIRHAGQHFFQTHPQALGVNLGCGLSNYFQWLDNGHNRWVDTDLPAVTDLRRQWITPLNERHEHCTLDLQAPGWWEGLGLPSGPAHAPVFLICEGVLMYFSPSQVQAFLCEFAQHAPPGSRLMMDVMSRLGLGMAKWHPTVGPTGAQFSWCPASTQECTQAHPRLRLSYTRSVAECYGWLGTVAEACWMPWTGTPLYSVICLEV